MWKPNFNLSYSKVTTYIKIITDIDIQHPLSIPNNENLQSQHDNKNDKTDHYHRTKYLQNAEHGVK